MCVQSQRACVGNSASLCVEAFIFARRYSYHPVETDLTPGQLNSVLGEVPTALQADAMLTGCMFGWDVPGADPDKLRERHRSLS